MDGNDTLGDCTIAVGELAKREGIDRRSVRRLLRLAFLSPRIAEAIVEGRQPPEPDRHQTDAANRSSAAVERTAGIRHPLITHGNCDLGELRKRQPA